MEGVVAPEPAVRFVTPQGTAAARARRLGARGLPLPPEPAVAWFVGTQLLETGAAVILEREVDLSGKPDERQRKGEWTGDDLPVLERARLLEERKHFVVPWVNDHEAAMRTTDEVVVNDGDAATLIGDVVVERATCSSGAHARRR